MMTHQDTAPRLAPSKDQTEAHPIDLHVGERVRLKRKELGITQPALATQLKVSFQQLQKYERGFNRISASKLYEIAGALDVPIGYFFDGAKGTAAAASPKVPVVPETLTAEEARLLEDFRRLKPEGRKFVTNAVRRLAAQKAVRQWRDAGALT
ncbi:helix-turn-helix family protein [Asticcacaulis biprosthecium C19]|uniref:Helix-turn-helix family protein n=1 Tax=Asticcacaulis biprosthecium C19 TaxID=715226 RepID=F4QSE2_9CAUL|nr:helix-turn-helix transcriptional regulator [Asticcacaulis biprosthecium]EGF89662.1 helix-turn-helix family protein [Asticcacaulis biprosthecium C19]